jgi:hypothetical protein
VAQFALAACDRVAVQAGDARQQRNTAAAVLVGEEAGEQTPHPLVRGRQQAI